MLHPFLHRAEHADTPRHRARPLRPTRRVCYFYLICASVPHVPHMHRCRLRQCAAQQRRMTRSAAPPRQSAQAPGRPPHSPGHWRARAGGGQAVSAPLRSDDSCDADDASPCRRRATRRHKHTTTSPRLTRHGWPRQGRRHSRRQGRRRTATAQPGRGTRHPAPNRSNARPQQAAPGFPWAGWASWPAGPALGSQASGLQPPNRLRLTARPRRRSSQCHESRHPSPNAVWRLSSSPPPPPPSPPPLPSPPPSGQRVATHHGGGPRRVRAMRACVCVHRRRGRGGERRPVAVALLVLVPLPRPPRPTPPLAPSPPAPPRLRRPMRVRRRCVGTPTATTRPSPTDARSHPRPQPLAAAAGRAHVAGSGPHGRFGSAQGPGVHLATASRGQSRRPGGCHLCAARGAGPPRGLVMALLLIRQRELLSPLPASGLGG